MNYRLIIAGCVLLMKSKVSYQRNAAKITRIESQRKELLSSADQIIHGDKAAVERLYAFVSTGVRRYIISKLRTNYEVSDIEDHVHDVFVKALTGIRLGRVRGDLASWVMGVANNQIMEEYRYRAIQRNDVTRADETGWDRLAVLDASIDANPQERLEQREIQQAATHALSALRPHESEVIRRFYHHNHAASKIKADMSLTDTQYRLLKSRSKAKFGQAARAVLGESLPMAA